MKRLTNICCFNALRVCNYDICVNPPVFLKKKRKKNSSGNYVKIMLSNIFFNSLKLREPLQNQIFF